MQFFAENATAGRAVFDHENVAKHPQAAVLARLDAGNGGAGRKLALYRRWGLQEAWLLDGEVPGHVPAKVGGGNIHVGVKSESVGLRTLKCPIG